MWQLILIPVVLICIAWVLTFLRFLRPMVTVCPKGLDLQLWTLIGMQLRRVPPDLIVNSLARLKRAGLLPSSPSKEP
jgi:uncharacterized protein YqfA (UPF0365 family)